VWEVAADHEAMSRQIYGCPLNFQNLENSYTRPASNVARGRSEVFHMRFWSPGERSLFRLALISLLKALRDTFMLGWGSWAGVCTLKPPKYDQFSQHQVAISSQPNFQLFHPACITRVQKVFSCRLPPFTGCDGFQVSLKILKVILCSDFLALHIIHHFPE